ncbi:carbohydrate kinase family protein [Nonomuraea jabiensis]|uniref:carbohydrate kinase family protein n=1 Tax=Nonomuraea jabiensis TaxID=882448 RepID=UPI003D731D24
MHDYPKINYGVEVHGTDRFMAGDGPLIAGMLTALGHQAALFSNPVADDPDGHTITERLQRWGVHHHPAPGAAAHTRINTVIADRAGNRTWFSGLKGITTELDGIDPEAFTRAPTVYLDCYEVLGETPRALLQAALRAQRRTVVNLGGSPAPAWLEAAVQPHGRISVLQTNADEHHPAEAEQTLRELTDLGIADLVMVTVGRNGAIGHAHTGDRFTVPALPVAVQQVQGAGSAFSAALIHALSQGIAARQAAAFACRAGSLWCSRSPHGRLPTLADLQAEHPG